MGVMERQGVVLSGGGGCPEVFASQDGKTVHIMNNQPYKGLDAYAAVYEVPEAAWLKANRLGQAEADQVAARREALASMLGSASVYGTSGQELAAAPEEHFSQPDLQALADALGSSLFNALPEGELFALATA